MSVPEVSFEFFPPRDLEASFRLWDTVQCLAPLGPRFVSVTYGAGGTTRDLTRESVKTLSGHSGLNVLGHLTCVGASRDETLQIARDFQDAGVTGFVALRGDPPKGERKFTAHPDGFADSCELISGLAELGGLNIKVGAYPEKHPEAGDHSQDIAWLKRKFEAGATEALTQFFFDVEDFLRFRDACAKAGIDGDAITPGILPVENWAGTKRFAARCGASIPADLDQAFQRAGREGRADLFATAVATELCGDLLQEGVKRFHFYTLNRPDLTKDICTAIGVTPKVKLAKVA